MNQPISQESIKQLFTEARSHHSWTDKAVSKETLHALYELMKWGPTSANLNPARITFIQSENAKEKLYPALRGTNLEQVKAAPVTAIIAFDERFYDHASKLFPAYDMTALFANDAKLSQDTAFRNSSLQGAYLIVAARALGLDTCPMSGFDNTQVDEAFFKSSTWRSNFICTIGYGDSSKLYPRGPRLDFTEACKIL